MDEAIYLDNAATTALAPGVLDAMQPYLLQEFGNPSSVHRFGRATRAAIDDARDRLAATIQATSREIVFTGGGSEADNLAIRGVIDRYAAERGRHVITSAIEHDAVLNCVEGLKDQGRAEATVIPPDASGRVNVGQVADAVRSDTVLVSLMLANNEVGTIQEVAELAGLVRERNPLTLIHTDAVQAFGKLPIDVNSLGVDLLSLSAHKVYGPKGVGALYVRHGVFLGAQISGGGQERNRRSGTENVAGIVGFAAAAELVSMEREKEMMRQRNLTQQVIGRLTAVPGVSQSGSADNKLPSFATFVIDGARTDVLLAALDQAGIAASGGSACSSGAPTPSHVLLAMGYPAEQASCALRLTVGRFNTEAEIARAINAIAEVIQAVRQRTPAQVS